eukprot:384924_1
MPHSKDPDVLHTLCETIYTSICSDPNTISTFKQNGLEAALHKTADDDANDLLSVLKEQDQIMNELNLINTIAVQRMDNPDDIDELKEKLQSVMTLIRSATNTPIKRNNRLILISEFDQLESYLNATNLGMLFWAKGVIRQRMNVAQDPRLKQIAITVHNVGKGSICIDYTLETYDIQLLDLAEKNIHSADKNITFLDDDTANNPQQPNEEATPHQFVASLVKPIHQSFVNLYKTKQGAELAVDAGTIQFVLQQVSDNPRTNECCVYAAKMIGALATECPAKTAKILEGDHGNGSGVSIIANTLNKLHSDPDTSAALIKVIHILCGNAELIHGLIEADAVQSVLNVLSMFNSGSSLMQLLLLIACMELLIKFSRLDGRVSGLIRRNGAMKSIGCIALAMDNNVESSQLIAVGRRALTEFVRQEDVHETMNIIARSQSDPDSFDRDMLHYAISIIGNMELIDANSQYVVSHNGIPLLLNIISDDAVDAILLSSTICALGRLLRTPKANAIWELKDGMKIFQDVINDCSYSEVIMLAMCDAINNMIKRKSELIPFITNKVFKSHSYYTQWVPKYYAMLSNMLGDTQFMTALIAAGLIDGVNNHLQRNKTNPQQVIASMVFITDLVSNQPELSAKVFSKNHKCFENVIDVIKVHENNPYTLASADATLYTLIQNQPGIINALSDEDCAVIEGLSTAQKEVYDSLDEATDNTLQQLLISRLSIFFESPSSVPEYYNLLTNPQHDFLDDTRFVRLLIEYGLIKGIKHYLQQMKDSRDDVIGSVSFVAHLVQKQPTYTKEIIVGLEEVLHKILKEKDDKSMDNQINNLLSLFAAEDDTKNAETDLLAMQDDSDKSSFDSMSQSLDIIDKLMESKAEDDDLSNTISQQLLVSLLTTKKVFESPCVSQYYNILMTPHREFLTNTRFVDSLVQNGLIKEIKHHLEQSKNRHDDMISSIKFITHLQSKQPHLTRDIMDTCAQGIVALIEIYATDSDVLQLLHESIRTAISNDPCVVSLFKDKSLLLLLKEQHEILNEFDSIRASALEIMTQSNQSKLKNKLQLVMSHINSASLIKPLHQSFDNLYKTTQCVALAVDAGAIQLALHHMSDSPRANGCCVYAAKVIGALAAECPAKSAKVLLSHDDDDDGNGTGLSVIINTLNKLHSDADIAAALIKLIHMLCCTDRDELIRGFIDKEGVQCLLQVLQKHAVQGNGQLAIEAIQSLVKCARFDDVFVESTLLITMKTIAYAMDSNPESSELKRLGSDALKKLGIEKHLSAVVDIIAEYEDQIDSFDLQFAVSLIGNMELSEEHIEYIVVERQAIPLFLHIISAHLRSDEATIVKDSIGLFSTVHALSRLLIATDHGAIATYEWQEHDGINVFETIVHKVSNSELVMIAVCDAIGNIVNTTDGAHIIKEESNLLPLLTKHVLKANGDYIKCIAKYYDILTNPDSEMLDNTSGLMESGLIEGINNHLQQNENKTDQVILSIQFISILLSKQPKYAHDIIQHCGQNLVNAIRLCTVHHSVGLDEVLRTLVLNAPNLIPLFGRYGSGEIMRKMLLEDEDLQVSIINDAKPSRDGLRFMTQHKGGNIFAKSSDRIAEYYHKLKDPEYQFLDDAVFVWALINEDGLISGMKEHLKPRKGRTDPRAVILSIDFLAHLLQKQPKRTEDILDTMALTIVNLVDSHRKHPDVFHSLCEAIHAFIRNDPQSSESFKPPNIPKGLEEVLNTISRGDPQIIKERNSLLSMLERQDVIMNGLRSISDNARKLKDNPNDIHLIQELEDHEQVLKSVIRNAIHTDSAAVIKPMQQHFVDLLEIQQGAQLLAGSGIVQLALKYMYQNPRLNDCCVYAAKIISSVANRCPVKITKILVHQLEFIVNALDQLHWEPDICYTLIETINMLCGLNSELIKGFIDVGAVQSALTVLNMFMIKSSIKIQMLLVATIELLIKCVELDDTVLSSINRTRTMENIAFAMDNHSESIELIATGRKAMQLFVEEADFPRAMRILARSQKQPHSKLLQDTISIVGNLVLIDAHAQYAVAHDGVRLLLCIVGGTVRDNQRDKHVLASAIRALGRLLNTDKAVHIWETNGGVDMFEGIIKKQSLSVLVMNAMSDAMKSLLSTKYRGKMIKTELLQLLTSKVFKLHSNRTEYKTWIRKYYHILSPILDHTKSIQSLIKHGLMDGVAQHLQDNKSVSDEVVLSLSFVIDLLSKHPDLIRQSLVANDCKHARTIADVIKLHKEKANAKVTDLELEGLQEILNTTLKTIKKRKRRGRAASITMDLIGSSRGLKATLRKAWDIATRIIANKGDVVKSLSKLNEKLTEVKKTCDDKNTSAYNYKTLVDAKAFAALSSCFQALKKGPHWDDAHKNAIVSAADLLHGLSQSKHSKEILDNKCYRRIAGLYLSDANHQEFPDLARYVAQITDCILQHDPTETTIQNLKNQRAINANTTIMNKFTNRKDRKDEPFASLAKQNITELNSDVHSLECDPEDIDRFARAVQCITDVLGKACNHTGFNVNKYIYIHGGACRDSVIKPEREPHDLDLQVDLHELHRHTDQCESSLCRLRKHYECYRNEYYYKSNKGVSKELDSGYFKRYFTSLVIINARYLLLEILNKDAEFKKHCQKIEKPKKHGDTIFTYKFVFEDHVEDVDVEIDFMDVACYFSTNNDRAIRNLKVRNKPYYVITHPFSLQRADCTFNALYIALSDIAESSKNYILPYKEWGQVVKDPCREYKDKYGKFSALSDLKKGIVRRMYIEFATETRTDDLDPDQAQFLIFRTLKNAFKLHSTGNYDTIYIHEQLQNADTGNWFKPNQWEKDRKRDQKGDDKKKKKGGQLDAVVRHAFRHNYFKKMDDSFIAAVYHMLGYDSLFFFYYKDEEGTPCFRKAVRKARKNKSKYPRANTIWKCMTQNIKRRKAECGGDLDLMIKSKPTQCQASDCLFIQLKGDDIISDESHQ